MFFLSDLVLSANLRCSAGSRTESKREFRSGCNSRGYTAARWDVNAYRAPAPAEFVVITALLSGPAILSTSLRVTISSMRHGGGATLQIA
jgi:hypothetical protein